MIKRDEMTEEYSREMLASISDKRVGIDVNTEINVPEYLPEIRRILNVSARVQPPSKYVGGTAVECNGTVDHKLLYMGIDGNMYSVSDSSEYSFSAPVDAMDGVDISNGMTTLVGICTEGGSYRLVSPRKVSSKTRLMAKVRAYANMSLCEDMMDGADIDVQRLIREAENVSVSTVSSDLMELNEELIGFSDDTRVISADAVAFISDIKRSEGRIVSDGDAVLKLLVCRDGGCPETVTRKLRFSGEIEIDMDNSEYYCKVIPTVTDISVNVEEGKIGCALSMVLNATVVKNKKLRYTEDAYFTGRECDCRREYLNTPIVGVCANGNFSVGERVPMTGATVPNGASVVDTWGNASLTDCIEENGKYVFTGQSKYCVLWEKDGEYGVYELLLPIRYETDSRGAGIQSFDASADVVSARARIDGENVSVDSEIAIQYDVMDAKEIRIVRECRVGETVTKKKRGIVVYYPSGDESAWDIAKKYKVCASSLVSEKNYYIL